MALTFCVHATSIKWATYWDSQPLKLKGRTANYILHWCDMSGRPLIPGQREQTSMCFVQLINWWEIGYRGTKSPKTDTYLMMKMWERISDPLLVGRENSTAKMEINMEKFSKLELPHDPTVHSWEYTQRSLSQHATDTHAHTCLLWHSSQWTDC